MRTPRRTPDAAAPALSAPPARGRRAHAGPPAEEHPGDRHPRPDSHPTPAATPEGRRLSLRPRTVRAKIVSLLMVPVVSLLALWAFATVSTAQDVARLSRLQQVDTEVRTPLAKAVTELQAERIAAVRNAAVPGPDRAAALETQGRRTDAALAALRLGDRNTVADTGDHPPSVAGRLRTFVRDAGALTAARSDTGAPKATPSAVFDTYTRVIDGAFAVGGALAGSQDGERGTGARVLLDFARAAELLSREDALLAQRDAKGTLTNETLRRFTGAVASRRTLVAAVAPDLPAAVRADWRTATKSAAYTVLTLAENKLTGALAAPGKQPVRTVPADWEAAHGAVTDAMREAEAAGHTGSAHRTDPLYGGLVSGAGAAVLFGLAAVAASLVISVRIGRGLVVELVSLRNGALEIAHHKLPRAMDRLRAGQDIDAAAEAPPGHPAEDEIAQVGEALSTVHRAALSAAVERAELASGVSGVFVNLARRSQVLVHRQLSLLDSMERRADDPSELGDLFRLDHLTTRMRRHAESLIILSGAAPGRAWRMPVALTNVVRAAVSEIEDYPRIEVRQLAEASVIGAAVADLTHLLAELIENAATFSPPHTKVRVSGEPVGNGYVLEVEDRGLGMGPETLAEANRRIEQSEALDLFDSDRLGLFVVSRLAARHQVKVHLRMSPYGGTTAVVLLPTALLQGGMTIGEDERPGGRPRDEEPEPLISVRGARQVEARRAPADRPGPAPVERPDPAPVARSRPRPAGPAEGEQPPAPVAALRPRGAAGAGVRNAAPGTSPQAPPAEPPPAGPPPAGATELPRRVRQASLVPQLREAPAPAPAAGSRAPEDPPGRTPEEARDRMAAYRAGWARGTDDAKNATEGDQS
ncbi:nitrate- and nitrite sensing domain-containing protein [Streptomyces sp. NPDC086023]|uniref:sensor histidine kinase n=1 Tax=Streptomyces sp. NPDC086023 TaxID=3365746 RepID=UPI0037D8C663